MQASFFESPLEHRPVYYPAAPGTSVNEWLDKSGFRLRIGQDPIVIKVNGRELMEAEYDYRLREGDVMELHQLPRGGTFLGLTLFQWFTVVSVVVSAVTLLTMPEPGVPETADIKEGSPTYSISARGNRYRPERKGPVLYGRLRVVPDFDQLPFSTYDVNNDQTLHMMFRVTQGRASVDVSSIMFEDTPLSNFTGVDVEVIQPGEVPTLFPVGVVESEDLNNVELTDSYTAAYVVNEGGTEISKIAIDMSSPGIAQQDRKKGHLLNYTVRFALEVQEIDDSNNPVGSWVEVGRPAFVSASRDPLRRTFEFPVSPGRYQARMRRITPKNTSQYVQDTVVWMRVKGYLHNAEDTSICTRVAISVRASEQIGNRALTDMSMIAHRELPTWDSVDGWQSPQLTRSIAWAMADLCRASYAGNRSDLHYDLLRLAELDAQLTPRQHYFDAYFDTEGVTVWDALVKAGTPGRITPIDRAGFYTFVRDEAQSQAVQAFTMRNIVRGSFSIQHAGVLEETADSIIVVIQDEDNDYRKREILCALPDSPAQNPREIELFGVTNATRAKELGMFMAASNRYRRKVTPFETGIEGRIPFYGDKIAISHYLLGVEGVPQVSGDIEAFDGVDRLRLTERVTGHGFTDPHIIMVDLEGRPMPAYPVTILDDFTVRVNGSPDWTQVRFDPGYKEPMFALGDGQTHITESKVTKIERDGDRVRVEAFVDDPRVYLFGDDVIPPPSVTIPAPQPAAPILSELTAHVGGEVDAPVVTLSWSLQNADRTDIEISSDGGSTWTALGRGFTLENQYVDRPTPGDYVYRVAAVNLFRGPWVSVQVSTEEAAYSAPLPPTDLALREPFTGPVLKLQWDSGSERHLIEVVTGGIVRYTETITGLDWDFAGTLAQEWGIGRSFDVRVYAVGENGKTSETYASISVYNPPPAQLTNLDVVPLLGQAMVSFNWPSGSDIAGISVWKGDTPGFLVGEGSLVIDASRDPVLSVPLDEGEPAYIRVGAVDVWGFDISSLSPEYHITGKSVDLSELEGKFPITETDIADDAISSPKLQANSVLTEHLIAFAVTAGKIAANAVTAEKINVAYLSALAADMGLVTAGTFQTTSGVGPRFIASSGGDFPMWIGEGEFANAANGHVYYNKVSKTFVFQDPTSGMRVEIAPGTSMPMWLGSGAKTAANAFMYWNASSNRLVVRGDVTANAIDASAVNIIDTLMIKGQAVTIPNGVQATAPIAIDGNQRYEVLSLTYTSSGSPAFIFFYVDQRNVVNVATSAYYVYLYRGSSEIVSIREWAPIGGGSAAFHFLDTPSAGSVTYSIRVQKENPPSTGEVQFRNLMILEVKR